jgi:tellurite resistance protein TerC
VFTLILNYFGIAENKQHAALHYGIIGAMVFRLVFTAIGVGFMETFGPLFDLVFAGLIIYSCYLMVKGGKDPDYDKIWWVIQLRKVFPGLSVFWICVIVLEISDILFAADSVPAIIAVTKDPFLIYSAMIFAILGLRSLYFVISELTKYLYYMEKAILWVLGFISIKLIVGALFSFHMSPTLSLFIIISILSVGAFCSVRREVEKCESTQE